MRTYTTDGNPWGVTRRQGEAMDAVCRLGCHKLAAEELGVSLRTVEVHCQQAGERMGERLTIRKYIRWHEWMRTRTSA